MRTLALTLVIVALSAVTATAGEFDDLIYQGQSPIYSNSILPGGCTKPDIYYPQGQWNQQGQWDQWSQWNDKPGYWNDQRWPTQVPRYYQKWDQYSQFDFGYQRDNLYAPGNEWRWRQQQNQWNQWNQPRRVYVDPWDYRQWDRHGNYWNTPTSSMNYNIWNGRSNSYGNWQVTPWGSNMVTGFRSPTSSFQFGINNTRYFDPWTLTSRYQPSFSFGLSIRR